MKASSSLVLSVLAVIAAGTVFSTILGQVSPRPPTFAPTFASAPSSIRSSSRMSIWNTSSVPNMTSCFYLIPNNGACNEASEQRTIYDATRDICKKNPGRWCNALPNPTNNPHGTCTQTGMCVVTHSSSFSSTGLGCAQTRPACNGTCAAGYRCGLINGGCDCYRVYSSSSTQTSSSRPSSSSLRPSSSAASRPPCAGTMFNCPSNGACTAAGTVCKWNAVYQKCGCFY